MAEEWTIRSQELIVRVSTLGAELQSIRDVNGTEYLWQGDPRYWTDRAPNLFPYVARLWKKTYTLDGNLYCMDIHGFAPRSLFVVREKTEDRLVLELTDSEQTRAAYPRAFAFRVCYIVIGRTLSVRYAIENRDEKPLYCGLGGHPGFRVPLRDGGAFSDYRLRFEAPQNPMRVGFTPDCFIDGTEAAFALANGTDLALSHTLFDDDAIVLKNSGHAVRIVDGEGQTRVRMEYPDMPYLGLWHMPHTDAPYICLEPWCSLPARHGKITDFAEQADLICCGAGETQVRSWCVTVD